MPPILQCDADAFDRAQRYSKYEGYAYLADNCELIMRWRQEASRTNIDVTVWLSQQKRDGMRLYDSPLAECGQKVTFDRRIKAGDAVAVLLWEDGTLRMVRGIDSWTPMEGWTLARVTHVESDWWGVSSGGRWFAIPITERSMTLDHEGYNVATTLQLPDGKSYDAPLDPSAPVATAQVFYPCFAGPEPMIVQGKQVSIPLGEIPTQ